MAGRDKDGIGLCARHGDVGLEPADGACKDKRAPGMRGKRGG